ncbi:MULTISPECIES: 4-phosphoerythronate dehydrogenase [unclassified Salinivibrio]|uniref:4-phosphoerythronate dehydrogenase n=1 Tax=unclassified Salinivibrio TaxID=2636825 RepID=UPI0006146AC2|nr:MULTISPECIES: 4-phosphoerythronate dehydrogenase [unclassified Salinivibrio]KKA44391.1 erythronate-4-phosphate dehydrogenase [Salinivibrio sp. KP-1]OOE68819.1 erythronate-4-phosphate dehydrogenase [Salinivibrio sp. IB868]OOE75034.1 erythronate-4-phosphate dehydrogenase [Salinivibrio sp. ML290]OOE77683.1 erythronate-4-phosphate dehydrogenase [Salinivibrio sp. IB870]OOE80101.1 erythronate-4-phosphate dehydrogenase [Salinivibrio sp. ML198]
MKIVVDENMPYAQTLFSQLGEVVALPGRAIRAADLIDADALMVRSVTQVNHALIDGATRLRFVGSATAGEDHLDFNALHAQGIHGTAAPGCNKVGVAEYVISALLVLAQQQGFKLTDRTVGIIGVGHVGDYLAARLAALGIKTLLCDPPRQARENLADMVDIDTLIAKSDVVTFHTPLTTTGEHPTYHLMNQARLEALASGSILINAARGPIVDNHALKARLARGDIDAVLDVYEHEPEVDLALMDQLTFATPHIAGYGLEGKARGTTMVFNALCEHLDLPHRVHASELLPTAPIPQVALAQPWQQSDLMALTQLVYDIRRDDSDFRRAMHTAGDDKQAQRTAFDQLRKNYWDRREYSAITVAGQADFGLQSLAKLGFSIEEHA